MNDDESMSQINNNASSNNFDGLNYSEVWSEVDDYPTAPEWVKSAPEEYFYDKIIEMYNDFHHHIRDATNRRI